MIRWTLLSVWELPSRQLAKAVLGCTNAHVANIDTTTKELCYPVLDERVRLTSTSTATEYSTIRFPTPTKDGTSEGRGCRLCCQPDFAIYLLRGFVSMRRGFHFSAQTRKWAALGRDCRVLRMSRRRGSSATLMVRWRFLSIRRRVGRVL